MGDWGLHGHKSAGYLARDRHRWTLPASRSYDLVRLGRRNDSVRSNRLLACAPAYEEFQKVKTKRTVYCFLALAFAGLAVVCGLDCLLLLERRALTLYQKTRFQAR
jgi:hypothetical protein